MPEKPNRRTVLETLGWVTVAAIGTGSAAGTTGLSIEAGRPDSDEYRWRFVPPAEKRGLQTMGTTSPTVVDGTVYMGTAWQDDRPSEPADGYRGGLYAIDVETGAADWEFETNGSVLGAPHVVDGTVYVIASVGPTENSQEPPYFDLYALDAESADVEWKSTVGHWANSTSSYLRGGSSSGGWGPSPTVYDGTLYVSSLVDPADPGKSASGGFVGAFDTANGSFVWKKRLDNRIQSGRNVFSTRIRLSNPTVQNGLVHVAESGAAGNALWAIDAETGAKRWRTDLVDGSVDVGIGQHTVADGVVYVDGGAAEGDQYRSGWAIDAETGDKLGEISGVTEQSLGPYNLTVSDSLGSDRSSVHDFVAQQTETGRSLLASNGVTWTTVADGKVYVCVTALEEAFILAVDVTGESGTNETIWSVSFDASATQFTGAPTLVNGTLYWSCRSDDGTALWAIPAGTQSSATDSRTLLGTLGHTDTWTGTDLDWDAALEMPDGELSGTEGGSNNSESADDGGDATGETDDEDGSADESPGMGALAALAGLGGASYLRARETGDDD
ncbi:Ser/Thr protein kinase [Halovivax asiaticus JCM 14624]|uniref:Ser/Thr protein kinase n=1 Tax=Halovivax asiaticus JCM 14624 TaxID=1227490 RepID=M0BUA4_9EURY|nr:PQQ-binding-like beta-propeller repeat protein [Halovivax asiaticus]ELZ13702.1 Ser/Thr protein kinase [Halovivax asiaticus JCM 14624]